MAQAKVSPKELGERQCMETFLSWYNMRFKTSLSYERAENVFPEILDSTRWDFVIREDEYAPWYAVEIKRMIKPEAIIQLLHWNKFLGSIIKNLGNRIQGEFLVYGAPRLQLEKHEKAELRIVLTEIILQNAQSLRNDELVDLGAQILGKFKKWPSTPHLNLNLSPPIEHVVNADSCFTLHKLSNTGCSLELGAAQSEVFRVEQTYVEALTSLFNDGEISKADSQLGLARHKGAKRTMLLLDCHLPSWHPNEVRKFLANNIGSNQLSNINAIYLVKSPRRVSKVWGDC